MVGAHVGGVTADLLLANAPAPTENGGVVDTLADHACRGVETGPGYVATVAGPQFGAQAGQCLATTPGWRWVRLPPPVRGLHHAGLCPSSRAGAEALGGDPTGVGECRYDVEERLGRVWPSRPLQPIDPMRYRAVRGPAGQAGTGVIGMERARRWDSKFARPTLGPLHPGDGVSSSARRRVRPCGPRPCPRDNPTLERRCRNAIVIWWTNRRRWPSGAGLR